MNMRVVSGHAAKKIWLYLLIIVLVISSANIFIRNNDVIASYYDPEMDIHAIYLNQSATSSESGDLKGDSTLIGSEGRFLLIDTGIKESATNLMAYLRSVGANNLDILITHMHSDHFGAIFQILESSDIHVGTIYLPDISIASQSAANTKAIIRIQIAALGKSNVTFVNRGCSFSFGDVTANVIGPVGNIQLSDFANIGSPETNYLNNLSLPVMFTCGDKKFLSCGDIQKKEQNYLLAEYGAGGLKADFYKMPHHGNNNAYVKEFIDAVAPSVSFVHNGSNSGYALEIGDGYYGDRKVQKQWSECSAYGFPYLVGDEKKSLLIHADSSGTKLYLGGPGGQLLSGWVTVQGGYSYYWQTDNYYFDPSTLVPVKGYFDYNGKHYYMGSGGSMQKAYYDFDGEYRYWRVYSEGGVIKFRYYNESGDFPTGIIGHDGKNYLLDSNGFRLTGMQTVDGKYYFMDSKGVMAVGKTLMLKSLPFSADDSGKLSLVRPAKIKNTKARGITGASISFKFDQPSNISSYEIQYSGSKNFPNKGTKTIMVQPAKSGIKSMISHIQAPKANKTYYIRIRAVRQYNSEIISRGSYSDPVKVKSVMKPTSMKWISTA